MLRLSRWDAAVLKACLTPIQTAEDISKKCGLPIYRVDQSLIKLQCYSCILFRSSYVVSEKGKDRLKKFLEMTPKERKVSVSTSGKEKKDAVESNLKRREAIENTVLTLLKAQGDMTLKKMSAHLNVLYVTMLTRIRNLITKRYVVFTEKLKTAERVYSLSDRGLEYLATGVEPPEKRVNSVFQLGKFQ